MVQNAQDLGSNILAQLREGMAVYDRNGEKVGTIDDLYMGASSEAKNEMGEGPATAPSRGERGDSLIDDVARAFLANGEIPEELRQRLLRDGFIRVNTPGLFTTERFVLPEQIAGIADDYVRLRVTYHELIKRSANQ